MKRSFCLVLCMVLIVSFAFAACSGSKNDGQVKDNGQKAVEQTTVQDNGNEKSNLTEAGTFPIVKEKVTLKIMTAQSPLIANMDENEMTKYMEEKTNVHVEWEVAPQLAETKSIILASADYPDAFLSDWGGHFNEEELMLYGQKGVFTPLNDLIKNYGVETRRMFEECPYVEKEITSPDGNIYSLPMVSETYHMMFRNKMWINKKWLEKLKLDEPKTTDEFYEVMKAFKEQDPNDNGKKDEIPLSGAIGGSKVITFYNSPIPYLMSSFITDDGINHWVQPFTGKLDIIVNKPEFRKGLEYIHKLYEEKLLDPEFITQEWSVVKQKGEHPEGEMLGAVASNCVHRFVSLTGERYRDYKAIAPLKGPDGVQTTAYVPERVYPGYFVITNKCKYPEVAFRWADWLYSEEGTRRSTQGREGEEWRKAEAGETGVNGKPAKWAPIQVRNEVQNANWAQIGHSLRTNEYRLSKVAPEDEYNSSAVELFLTNASKLYDGYHTEEVFPTRIFVGLDKLEELNQLKQTITDYINNSMFRFITGDLSLESDWDNYAKTLDDMGLERYIELYQEAYDNIYK